MEVMLDMLLLVIVIPGRTFTCRSRIARFDFTRSGICPSKGFLVCCS